jgi:hypothetical protein
MPDRFGVVSFEALDQSGDFPSENVGDRAAIAADRIGIARAFGTIGIADAAGDELKRLDLAMRAVGERNGEGNAVEPGLGCLNGAILFLSRLLLLQVKPIARIGQSLAPDGRREAV